MNGRFLLDTNIVIALWANDEAVTLQMATANETFIPSIVFGKLYYSDPK